MQTLQDVAAETQAVHPLGTSGEIHPTRKVGVEIVRSVELPSRFYGQRPYAQRAKSCTESREG